MALNIRGENVKRRHFSTWKRSGKTNYVKKIEKCQDFFGKKL